MPTHAYTFAPLRPPFDDWDISWTGHGGDPHEGTAWAEFTLLAANPTEAEQRACSWVDYNCDDDLRGAVATATATATQNAANQYRVRINYARPRN